MSDHLDQLFKKALHNESVEPPAYIWGNIEQRLSQKGKKKAGLWWYGIAAGLALLTTVAGTALLEKKEKPNVAPEWTAHNPALYGPVKSNAINLVTSDVFGVLAGCSHAVPAVPAPKQPVRTETGRVFPELPQRLPDFLLENTPSVPELKHPEGRRNLIPLTNGEAFRNHKAYQELLREERQEEENRKQRLKFRLSGHLVPGYSAGSYSSSLKNTSGNTYSGDQMDGLMNVGGGLKIALSAGKRFSVETGMIYSRMGQRTRESGNGVRASALSSLNARTITTPLGNINYKTKSVAYRTAGATLLNAMGNTNESLEQIFGTLEIPFSVRCRLNHNKVRFFLSGGFSGNFIVSNKVYLETDESKEYLGSTEDIRDFNLSTDWGFGIEYPLSHKIRLMVEPGFKYYLQSLSENRDIHFKPYVFSLSTGIGIEF